MRLFNYWRSSSSWRVRIALAHKGIEYDYVPVHLVRDGGEQRQAEFLTLNAAGQVPLLEFEDDHGNVRRLGQSLAILDYLEEEYPAPPLLPVDRYERARAKQLAELVNAGIQPLQNLTVIQRLKAMELDWKTWCQDFMKAGFEAYEATVVETAGDFSVGNDPSWADVCLVPQLYNARRFEVDLTPYPRILAIESACFDRPEFDLTRPERMADAQ